MVEDADVQETWEVAVPGGVNAWVRNRRTGEYEKKRVHGTSGPKVLRLSKDDRLYNQELIPEESKSLDPFTNGSLVLVKDGKRIGITEDSLREYLEIKDAELLLEAVDSIGENELSVRRLYALAEKEGTMEQVNAIRDYIEDHYKVGGTQRTVEEMFADGDAKGEVLSM